MTAARQRPNRLALASVLLLAACATNPATGERQLSFLDQEDEIALGQAEHPKVLAQFGGAYDDPAVAAEVTRIGERLKANSELADLDFTFTVLNSHVVNAFALPGGYVYVSRGLLAYANDEAELAGVLGHEIGHVTARHTAQRVTRGQLAQAGVLAATIGAAILGGQQAGQAVQQLGGAGAQAYLASYSRDQELQADDLGVRYAARSGYDPRGMSGFLNTLDRQSQLAQEQAGKDGDAGFDWFSTHPRTPERVARAAAEAGARQAGGEVDRDAYLAAISGLLWGDDPRQGMVRGREFVHPELRIAFTAPDGMQLINTPEAVIGQSPSSRLRFDLARVPPGRDLVAYVRQDWARELGAARLADVRASSVRQMAAAVGQTSGSIEGHPVSVVLAAIRADGDAVYRFLFLHQSSLSQAQARADEASVNSFRRLTAKEAAAIKPKRLTVVTVRQGETVADLAARMAVDQLPRRQFEVLNGLQPGATLTPGQKVKLVVDG